MCSQDLSAEMALSDDSLNSITWRWEVNRKESSLFSRSTARRGASRLECPGLFYFTLRLLQPGSALTLQPNLDRFIPEQVLYLQGLMRLGHSFPSIVEPQNGLYAPKAMCNSYFTWN
jgi:hypothetical protein